MGNSILVNVVSQEIQRSHNELTFVPVYYNAKVSQPLEKDAERILMLTLITAVNEKVV